ncbi:phage major capsid protein [Mycobacterium sp.]|uniref:phage major capsid protein n=1 Tax=Mycobacterium sp. TaxID=1785 RepID=UPI003F9E45C8
MTYQLTSNSAAVIQETVQSYVIEPLVAISIVLQQNPRTFRTSAPIRVPRLAAASGLQFYAEGTQINTNDVSLDEVDLIPATLESLKTITVVSNQLIRSAVLGVSQVLQDRIVYDIALALDSAFITGSGTAGTNIIGLLNQPSILTQSYEPLGSGATAAAGSLGDPDTYLAALGTFSANHLDLGSSKWLIHPTDWFGSILTSKDSLGRPLVVADVTGATPGSIFGVPVVISTQITQGTVALIDFSRVLVAIDELPDVQVLIERYADYDSTGLKVVTRADLQLAHPQAVLAITAAA